MGYLYRDSKGLEVFKIDITSAYLNTPMNDDVTHKWLLLDKDVASVLMSMDENYWKTCLRKLLLNLMLPMLSTWMARAILEAALVSKVTIR